MAGGIGEYVRETRAELRHVAWPTRTQTVVYSILVVGISVGVAMYLGFFDFLFTGGLERLLTALPQSPQSAQGQSASTSPASIPQAPAASSTPH